jgi:tetratricopeptide (TPR) repeat protein
MAMLTAWMERTQVGARGPEWDLSFAQRILIAGRAIWFYVEKLFAPVGLSFIYRRWNIASAPAAWWIFPVAVIIVAAVLFALRRTVGRGPLVAWLIFCGVLVPALGFFNFYPMKYSFVADHFQYLAGPALIALLVAGVAVALRKIAASAPATPYVVAGLVLVVLSVLTVMQARVYGGPLLLWDDAIKNNPTSPMLHYNYGSDLMAVTEQVPRQQAIPFVEEAARQFEATVKLEPTHDRSWTRWGGALVFLNKPKDALDKFAEALKLRPDNVDALGGRGRALFELGRLDEAQAAFNEALAAAQAQRGSGAISRTTAAAIYQFRGKIAVAKGDLEQAATQYAEAVRIVPDDPQIRYEYGTVLARLAKMSEGATTQATTTTTSTTSTTQVAVAATRPAAAAATTTPATTQASTQPSEKTKKLMAAAAAQFASAIELRPDFVDARVALANLMMDVGNITAARLQLEVAVRVGGNNPPAALRTAVERWDAEFRKREAAATQRATTGPAATGPTTNVVADQLRRMTQTQDSTSKVFTMPATQPASR